MAPIGKPRSDVGLGVGGATVAALISVSSLLSGRDLTPIPSSCAPSGATGGGVAEAVGAPAAGSPCMHPVWCADRSISMSTLAVSTNRGLEWRARVCCNCCGGRRQPVVTHSITCLHRGGCAQPPFDVRHQRRRLDSTHTAVLRAVRNTRNYSSSVRM